MDKEAIRRALPETARPGMIDWVQKNVPEELGREYLVWRAIRQRGTPPLEYLMDNQWHEGLSYWAAEVTCTDCGESFITAGGGSSFWLACGEDGLTYTVGPEFGDPQSDCFCDTIEVTAGDSAMCPYCQHMNEVIHAKSLRGGRTKRVMTVTVENVEGYAAILYWMVERNITENGSTVDAVPMYAYLIGERGGITKYRHGQFAGMYGNFLKYDWWQLCMDNRDQIQCRYHDWGSINNKKVGAVVYPFVDSLIGTTGEKTGLFELAASGATQYLLDYVKMWYRWKPAEILVKEGFTRLLGEILDGDVPGNAMIKLASVFDMGARKPNQMLGITRAEYREGMEIKPKRDSLTGWALEDFRTFRKIRDREPQTTPGKYIQHKRDFGSVLDRAIKMGEPLDKLRRYLEKQGLHGYDAGMLEDTRRMIQEVYNRPLTAEEMWPRDLIHAHDAIAAIITTQKNEKKAAMYAEGFREIKEEFGHLEWSDGDLCLILPLSNSDLVREGDVLRHCVGGYGQKHIEKTGTIWFVRHKRRPERPYYTLNINMIQGYEIQLHGYGNERHGPNKQYSHSIPQKVRDFCTRWEREVLAPYIRERNRKEKSA